MLLCCHCFTTLRANLFLTSATTSKRLVKTVCTNFLLISRSYYFSSESLHRGTDYPCRLYVRIRLCRLKYGSSKIRVKVNESVAEKVALRKFLSENPFLFEINVRLVTFQALTVQNINPSSFKMAVGVSMSQPLAFGRHNL